MRVQRATGQVHRQPTLRQHAGFGRQHIQVIAQARLVALHRDRIGVLCSALGGALLRLLANNGLRGSDLVRHIANRVNHCGVVAFHRRVKIGRFAAQISAQATRLKNRQPQGGAYAPLLAA